MAEVLLTWTLRLNLITWGFLNLCTKSSQRNNHINVQSVLSSFAIIFARLLLSCGSLLPKVCDRLFVCFDYLYLSQQLWSCGDGQFT